MFLYAFQKARGARHEEIKYTDFIGSKNRITELKYNEMWLHLQVDLLQSEVIL
jgi:hypothetical protein